MSTTLLLTQTRDPGMPRVGATGSGELAATLTAVSTTLTLTGTGTGTLAMTGYEVTGPLQLTGDGTTGVTGARDVVPEMRLEVLDPVLNQAPTAITIMLFDARPKTVVTFNIDGTVIATRTANSSGGLGPLSLAVPESVGAAGTHTITATQAGSLTASATFTLRRAPVTAPRIVGPDADPVDIPGALTSTGVRRWILQDLMPGGLGSYILPHNPTTMSDPHFEKLLEAMPTTSSVAVSGQFHVFEGGEPPAEWQFSGYCPTQAMHDKLVAYAGLKRRFYIVDHRRRAWKTTIVSVDLTARRRQARDDGTLTDWAHDYTVNALVYDRNWKSPQ